MGMTTHEHICTGPRDCRICGPDSGTRHPKWQRVEPGTVIPAGQPYRVEFDGPGIVAHECIAAESRTVDDRYGPWFVDSSWRPPLELPTKPTWGIAFISGHRLPYCNQWRVKHEHGSEWFVEEGGITTAASGVLDFIPLTDEQVARIEAAR